MITIKSISIVVPSEPTPNGPLQLSESDQIMPWTHPTFIYIYRSNNNIPLSFENMNNSLSRALAHFYPLAGRLKWIEGGRLQVDCVRGGFSCHATCRKEIGWSVILNLWGYRSWTQNSTEGPKGGPRANGAASLKKWGPNLPRPKSNE